MEEAMLITEQQAKGTMWCPMVSVRWKSTIGPSDKINPGAQGRLKNAAVRWFFPRLHHLFRAKYFRCMGSGCVMWRWEDRSRQRGFCGLAGTPLEAALVQEAPEQRADMPPRASYPPRMLTSRH
jgi:hypothetical protein